MIQTLRARNFQGLVDVTIDLGKLTILYGANEAGKSSCAEAIAWVLASDLPAAQRRLGTGPELVLQGAKKCQVDIQIDDHVYTRIQGKTGGSERQIDGVKLNEPEFFEGVRAHMKLTPDLLGAALRTGQILNLKSQDLLNTLMTICGGGITSEAIAAELASLEEPLKRIRAANPSVSPIAWGWQLPGNLQEMNNLSGTAIEVRKEAKRQQARHAETLARFPVIPADLRTEVEFTDSMTIDEERENLRDQIKAAMALRNREAGRSDERVKQLEGEIAYLEAIPVAERPPDHQPPLRNVLAAATIEETECQSHIRKINAGLAQVRTAAEGDKTLPEGWETIEERLRAATLTTERAIEAFNDAGREYVARRDLAAAVQQGNGKCSRCQQVIDLEHIETLKRLTGEAFASLEVLRIAMELAQTHQSTLQITRAPALVVSSRIAAQASVERGEAALKETEADLVDVTAERVRLQKLVDAEADQKSAFDRYFIAQHALPGLRAQLTEAQQPTTEGPDIPTLETRARRLEQIEGALITLGRIAEAKALLSAAERLEKDADEVAKECGPDGAQGRLVSRAVQPFFAAANEALAQLVAGYTIELVTHDGPELVARRGATVLAPSALSSARRRTVLYALQIAEALLAKAPIVAFDEIELINDAGRQALGRLAEKCANQGIQVLLLTSNPTPVDRPAGIRIYEMTAGQAARLLPVRA